MVLQFAGRFSLIAFITAVLRGVLGDGGFEESLRTALIITAAFYGLGLIVGELARRVVEEQVEAEFSRWKAAQGTSSNLSD